METANMCIQGTPFLHPPPPIPQGHPNLHHIPPPPMNGARGHNIDFHSQVATSSSRRFPTNSTSHTSMNPFQDGGVEVGPRFVGPVPLNSLRIYRPSRRDMMLDATPRQQNLPHLRVLPEDVIFSSISRLSLQALFCLIPTLPLIRSPCLTPVSKKSTNFQNKTCLLV